MRAVPIPAVNTPVDYHHWFIATKRAQLKRDDVICYVGEKRTFVYTIVSRSRTSDSLLVRYRKEAWKRDRTTVLNNIGASLERGIILIHDGASRA